MSDDGNLGVEVAVVGAGLAGLAAATVAARQGSRSPCSTSALLGVGRAVTSVTTTC